MNVWFIDIDWHRHPPLRTARGPCVCKQGPEAPTTKVNIRLKAPENSVFKEAARQLSMTKQRLKLAPVADFAD